MLVCVCVCVCVRVCVWERERERIKACCFFFFFNWHCNPSGLWPAQQEGFYRVLLPAARQTPNSEDQWLECSNSRHQASLTSETTQANPSSGTMGEKFLRILPEVAISTSLLGSFTCRKFTTWDRQLYFPSKEGRTEDSFAWKIRRLRPGLNPRIWVPKASTLTSRPPKPLRHGAEWWKSDDRVQS